MKAVLHQEENVSSVVIFTSVNVLLHMLCLFLKSFSNFAVSEV